MGQHQAWPPVRAQLACKESFFYQGEGSHGKMDWEQEATERDAAKEVTQGPAVTIHTRLWLWGLGVKLRGRGLHGLQAGGVRLLLALEYQTQSMEGEGHSASQTEQAALGLHQKLFLRNPSGC